MADREETKEQRAVRMDRRQALTCMTWAGTGLLWSVAGGVPLTAGVIGSAKAAPSPFTFVQISDSHLGFDKAANPDVTGTLKLALDEVGAMKKKPAFMIHTGDISHLSKPQQFDDADGIISKARLDVHYVPGEHDMLDEEVKLYRERYARGASGAGW